MDGRPAHAVVKEVARFIPWTDGDTTPADGASTDGESTDGASTDGVTQTTGGLVADHDAADAFANIPSSYVSDALGAFHIYYAHTSHGGQIA